MYRIARSDSDPRPLDFNTSEHTDAVADAFGSDPRPRDQSLVPALDTGSLLAEIGLSARAIREVQARSSAPEV